MKDPPHSRATQEVFVKVVVYSIDRKAGVRFVIVALITSVRTA